MSGEMGIEAGLELPKAANCDGKRATAGSTLASNRRSAIDVAVAKRLQLSQKNSESI